MERRQLKRAVQTLVSPRLEADGFLALFTERTGGASTGPYRSLNVAYHTGDHAERVLQNRRTVCAAVGIEPFAVGEQVHGRRLIRVGTGRKGAGFDRRREAIPNADALAVSRPGLPVAVLTADCVPIALASARQGLAVAVHAGWRGMAAGILGEAVALFDEPGSVQVAIGPAVGPCHYEVSPDVALAVASGSESGAVTTRKGGKLFLDLERTAARTLRTLGVRRIDRAGLCTACDKGRFFSHRRDGETGRHAFVVMRL